MRQVGAVHRTEFDPLKDFAKEGEIAFKGLGFQWKGIKPSDAYTGLLLDATLDEISKTTVRSPVVEIGTGCGAIAICTGKEFPNLKIIATDIDLEQIRMAQKNANRNRCNNVVFYVGDMFAPIVSQAPFSLVVGSLPLKATFDRETADTHRDAGPRGVEKVIPFLREGREYLASGGKILTVVNSMLLPVVERHLPSLEIVRSSEDITPTGETLEYFQKLAKILGVGFNNTYRTAVVSLGCKR
jgi:methylase of polypeptide subunit release factors